MVRFTFHDGSEINTAGPYRAVKAEGRWYVAGNNTLINATDQQDAENLAAEMKQNEREWILGKEEQ
jgi:hypothetical protein